ncbi:MAG: putative PEP-binding protein [Pseudomonadota bacterium]
MDGGVTTYSNALLLDETADVPSSVYGARAETLSALFRAGAPVPPTWLISSEAVEHLAEDVFPDDVNDINPFQTVDLIAVRASPIDRAWGGPESLLNIGMTDAAHERLVPMLGRTAADAMYFRFIQDFSVQVARLDGEDFADILADAAGDYSSALPKALSFYALEVDEPFPQDPQQQLFMTLASLSKAWNGTSARLLRSAKGAPEDAGLGLIVQAMALGHGAGESGSGLAQFRSPITGERQAYGRYYSKDKGLEVRSADAARYLSKDPRGLSLEEICPKGFQTLQAHVEAARKVFKDDMWLEFTLEDDEVWILDARPAERSGQAAVRLVVDQVQDQLKSSTDALLAIDPRMLTELLHPRVNPKADQDVLASGIGASPGAATGALVFSSTVALQAASKEQKTILVRVETAPEDIRGMHAAQGIVTERGGITSHAAVVARGLGVPCIVGASDLSIDAKEKVVTLPDGTQLREGDTVTIDGTSGHVMRGAPGLVEPNLDGAFQTFMEWADGARTLGVRANADSPSDARAARLFGVDGIGLCRTEHMFFEVGRLTTMRELIFAEDEADRQSALDRLMPMQRGDFIEIFSLMQDQPVCIRLLDPPLHEFLPQSRQEMKALAEAMDVSLSRILERVEAMREINPMLGTRGVRLGIMLPEIYAMQSRAIFEAAAFVQETAGRAVVPEIMIPLVSAKREVDLVKAHIEAVRLAVEAEGHSRLRYKLGVMVETPRAALRAGDIAQSTEFFSFGTNDLTQMTYGLSRDDAGRFMREYVAQAVYSEDPFHTLDPDGVGELLAIATERGRTARSDLTVGLCGEHGGDPASVELCHQMGFDYVSCSPFRTPIARLCAAQAAIRAKK